MQNVFDILEWPRVLAHLESCCQTGYGRLLITEESVFLADIEEIQAALAQVDEAKRLIQRYGDIQLKEPPDIMPLLKRLAKQGQAHSPLELSELLIALKALRLIARFLIQNRSREESPRLLDASQDILLPNPVIEQLEGIVSENGDLLPGASLDYARLLQTVQELKTHIKQTLTAMMSRPTIAKYLQEPLITEREGRSVLPVKAEHKVDVPGIVHGTSSSGVTLFIEPKSVVEQNNKLRAAQAELDREIQRILKSVSETLHPEAEALITFVNQMGQLDLLLAKARQSLILKANPVTITDTPGIIAVKQARHPLLVLQLDNVIANDIEMHPPHQTMLITGPNTGGKTVLLKLIGLFALMTRAGLHVPAAEGSALSLFHPVLADIGDPQSLTQNLSTFSGHITRLKSFLDEADLSHSLILIDEICAGTDPQEGAALAQALLQAFHEREATAIVTTHIGALKAVAHQTSGYINASVEFNAETFRPTYRLILGVPGTSHALNIANELGISDEIITTARQYLAQPVSDSAALIESLESKNRQINQELEEARRLREEIQWEEEQTRKQLNLIEGEKKKTLQLYRDSLRSKLRGIEQEVDELKKNIREQEALDNQSMQKLSGRFKKAQSQTGELFSDESQKLYPNPGFQWEDLKIGDTVESRSLSLTGTVIEKHPTRQELTIQSGILKTTIPFSDVIQTSKRQQKRKEKERHGSSSNRNYPVQPSSWSIDCDVRGLNSEDAIGILEKFLDDALLSGVQSVHVIHGQGTGVLKKSIRAYLKDLSYIKHYGPAAATDGGDGKTIIEL